MKGEQRLSGGFQYKLLNNSDPYTLCKLIIVQFAALYRPPFISFILLIKDVDTMVVHSSLTSLCSSKTF